MVYPETTEKIDPNYFRGRIRKRRYILCFNPEKLLEERKQRENKLSSIKEYLERWNNQLLSSKKSKDKELLSKKIYAYLKE